MLTPVPKSPLDETPTQPDKIVPIKIINKMIKKLSVKEIVSFINYNRSISKKEIYNYCLRLKDEK